MALSMLQRRQEAERERVAQYEATLRLSARAARPAPDFRQALSEARRGFARETLREASTWQPQMKTRDPARLRLAAARHLFARYPVPAPLEHIWVDQAGLDAEEVRLRKYWYIVVARGGSLFKACARGVLSRKEVHAFLNPPAGLGFDEAFWHAIARSCTDDPALALRIARSKIARAPRREIAFWRGVARFFCQHPVSAESMDDLCDYLAASLQLDPGYSLEGRTLATLTRGMREWHRDALAIARVEAMRQRYQARDGQGVPADKSWRGLPVPDWSWSPKGPLALRADEHFVVRQLRRADELVHESSAMHHCVWSYADRCICGESSIWSLRRVVALRVERLLTIEVDREGCVIQVRGFANRLARPEERDILERWAKARGLVLR